MIYTAPGRTGSVVEVDDRYDNFIGGKWVPPRSGTYMTNLSPATATQICEVARSSAQDVDDALDAAHAASAEWGRASQTERAAVLNKIADAIDANREMLAVTESWENGKPVRESLNADVPLAADHFRYFASAVRSLEGRLTVGPKGRVTALRVA